jgi:hypothetical protein
VPFSKQVNFGPNPAPIFSGYYNNQYSLNIAACTNRTDKRFMIKTELAGVIANSTVNEIKACPVCGAKASNQRLRRGFTKRTPRNKERRATAQHGANVLLAESFKAIETISGV